MAANTSPIFSIKGDISEDDGTTMPSAVLTATGDYTGASANHELIFTADATDGGYVERLRFKALGTNVATVARIYINNGSANTTAGNNVFFGEISLPATTASNTVATADIDYPMGFALKAGFRIYVGVATTVASGWRVSAVAGQYA
jgi:hypothetical protein